MRVVEIETQDTQRRYVVIDEDGKLIEPIVCYLKYLDRIGSARQDITLLRDCTPTVLGALRTRAY